MDDSLCFLVIDADSISRQRLLSSLVNISRHFHIHPCDNVKTAEELLAHHQFDAWFMDIDLPGISGFGFLDEKLRKQQHIPALVFTTQYKDFALKAFDYPVLDYLLKPICPQRLERSIDKLSRMRKSPYVETCLNSKKQSSVAQPISTPLEQTIRFKNGSQWLRLNRQDVLWIEAVGNYMCVHTLTNTHILRTTLTQLEAQLCEQQFVKISRSGLVNWQNVMSCQPANNGNYQIELVNKLQLKVSRKYKLLMTQLINKD